MAVLLTYTFKVPVTEPNVPGSCFLAQYCFMGLHGTDIKNSSLATRR